MNAVKIYENAKWKLEHNEITLGEFEKEIKPLEDVVEVKHSGWTYFSPFSYKCMTCLAISSHLFDFCPYCGADMRGEKNEQIHKCRKTY